MAKRVLMPLAPGFEEIEAIAVVDILRRAGATVVIAATTDEVKAPVIGRGGVKVVADTSLESVKDEEFDMVVLPGGGDGTENLKNDQRVAKLVCRLFEGGGFVAAICAATTVLTATGVTDGRKVTCHPTVAEEIKRCDCVEERVVVDGTVITSRGPGTAIEFAYALVAALFGAKMVEEVNSGVLARI